MIRYGGRAQCRDDMGAGKFAGDQAPGCVRSIRRRSITALVVLTLVTALVPLLHGERVHAVEALAIPDPPPQPLRPFPQIEITARSAVLVDGDTGQMIYGLNPHERRATASITKIATAIVALENDTPSRVVTVHVDWWDLSDSTVMGLFRGERLSIEDLVEGLMLPSGNDAAVALGYAVAGSPRNFVDLMNQTALELGLRNTHFSNPHGLDEPGHYTSAYDITMFARYAMENPLFAQIAATKSIEVRGRSVYPLRNINRFLWSYPGAVGVKNGYTDDAGQTLVGAVFRDGRRVYVTVMKSDDYVGDAEKLLDYYFAHDAGAPKPSPSAQGGQPSNTVQRPEPGAYAQPWFDRSGSPTGQVPHYLRAQ